jgi:hypothetical protein
MRDHVTVFRLPLAVIAAVLVLAACEAAPPAQAGPPGSVAGGAAQVPPRVHYHFDGSDAQLEHIKRLAGYYCEDRYQKNAGLVRTTKGNDGFSQAVYKCI